MGRAPRLRKVQAAEIRNALIDFLINGPDARRRRFERAGAGDVIAQDRRKLAQAVKDGERVRFYASQLPRHLRKTLAAHDCTTPLVLEPDGTIHADEVTRKAK